MVRRYTSYKVAFALFIVLVSGPVFAAEPLKPMRFNGRYTIAWSGITLGRILIQAHEDDTSYRMSIDTKTRGIGALISDEKRIVEAQGTRAETGEYLPTRYNSRPQKNLDDDEVTLTYDEAGKLEKRTRKKDDDPSWRPPVPVAEANTATDPVTAAFILRRKLYAAMEANQHEVASPTYDGLRLAEMKLIRSSTPARVEVMGAYRQTISAAITRTPINGYTPKELKKFKKGDPEIRIFFSDDAAFLPVRASAKVPLGELSMTLVKME